METNVISNIDLNLNESNKLNDKPVDELYDIEKILDKKYVKT